jgi:voltage-gated potassium channel
MTAMVDCPKSHPNPVDHKFCGECGAQLATELASSPATGDGQQTPLERWQERAEVPLAGVGLVFILGASIDVIFQPHGKWDWVVPILDGAAWLVFFTEFWIRFRLADKRLRWLGRHLIEFVIIMVPALRAFQIARAAMSFNALRKLSSSAFRGQLVLYTAFGAVLLAWVASLGVLRAERGHNDEFHNIGDARWWSITTITTVGYGDTVPKTAEGRLWAAGLMLGAIGLVGSITATFASWIVQHVAEEDLPRETIKAASSEQIAEVRTEIKHLADALERHGVAVGLPSSPER